MYVAELGDFHAVEFFGQSPDLHVDFFYPIPQASSCKTIGGRRKRQRTSQVRGCADERAARRIDNAVAGIKEIGEAAGAPSQQQNEFYGEKSEERSYQPNSRSCHQPFTAKDARDRMAEHGIEKSHYQQNQTGKPPDLKYGSKRFAREGRDPMPGAKQPKTLREIDEEDKSEKDQQSYKHRVSAD